MDIVYKNAAKAIVLRNNGGILEVLTFKYLEAPNPKKTNKNGLPGGKLDENESYEDALHREVCEETGLKIKVIGDPLGEFTFQYTKHDVTTEVACKVFSAIVTDGQLITENKKEATTLLSAPFWHPIPNANLDDFVYDEAPFIEIIKNNQEKYLRLVG